MEIGGVNVDGVNANVIDIGCGPVGHEGFDSLEYLCDEFNPGWAIGLDPRVESDCYQHGDAFVVKLPVAGWTRRGTLDFHEDTSSSRTYESGESDGDTRVVPCVDVALLVRAFAPVVLKIDAEGAEYPILEHLIDQGLDEHIHLAWIEWHSSIDKEDALIKRMKCEYRQWTF